MHRPIESSGATFRYHNAKSLYFHLLMGPTEIVLFTAWGCHSLLDCMTLQYVQDSWAQRSIYLTNNNYFYKGHPNSKKHSVTCQILLNCMYSSSLVYCAKRFLVQFSRCCDSHTSAMCIARQLTPLVVYQLSVTVVCYLDNDLWIWRGWKMTTCGVCWVSRIVWMACKTISILYIDLHMF